MYMKKNFYCFYYFIVRISINNVLRGLKFVMRIDHIHVEGTVSQVFVLSIILYFMTKNG